MKEQTGPVNKVAARGKAVVAGARDKAADVVDSARGGTGNLQATLADRLEAGAQTLRARVRGKPDDVRITGSRPSIASRSRARTGEASRTIADGMDRTAMWLRENDLTDLANLLQRELRERPGRVALVALGVGILVGRATRRRR